MARNGILGKESTYAAGNSARGLEYGTYAVIDLDMCYMAACVVEKQNRAVSSLGQNRRADYRRG